ncbi:MAG: hypothetical protein PHQ05_07400 [Sterolibacterium sp.]|nr:hypothetical protein [Sterolibacterium sp.]
MSKQDVVEDFCDIFTLIMGFAELAAANPHIRSDAKLARYLDEIRKSGQRGSKLVQQWAMDDSDAAKR